MTTTPDAHTPPTPDLDAIREWLNTDPYDDPMETQLKQAVGHIRTLFTAIDDRDTTINAANARLAALTLTGNEYALVLKARDQRSGYPADTTLREIGYINTIDNLLAIIARLTRADGGDVSGEGTT